MYAVALLLLPFAVMLKEPAPPSRGRIGEVGDVTFPITANSTSFACCYGINQLGPGLGNCGKS